MPNGAIGNPHDAGEGEASDHRGSPCPAADVGGRGCREWVISDDSLAGSRGGTPSQRPVPRGAVMHLPVHWRPSNRDGPMSTMPRWIARSPRLLHLTVAAARSAITTRGLRPTTWLVERAADLDEAQREELLTEPRRESVWIDVQGHRTRLRDQQPLGSGWTSRLLEDEDPADYLRALNDQVFLFPSSAAGLARLKAKYVGDGCSSNSTPRPSWVMRSSPNHSPSRSQPRGDEL